MAIIINTNIGASVAQAALTRNSRDAAAAMEQLSSGNKINSAADDAAGLAIANRMTAQIRGLGVAIQNAHDALNMVSTADGAASEMSDLLQRARELALQAANGTTDAEDRTYLNMEYQALIEEIRQIALYTQWNGNKRLGLFGRDGYLFLVSPSPTTGDAARDADYARETKQFVIGTRPAQSVGVHFGNFNVMGGAPSGTVFRDLNVGDNGGSISATTTLSAQLIASAAITAIDTAFDKLSTKRAEFGAATNRLTYAVDNLSNVLVNAKAARSRVLDADYAVTTSKLAKAQILRQASMAMISQANALPETVMMFLRD